jgi:hypothetical protein
MSLRRSSAFDITYEGNVCRIISAGKICGEMCFCISRTADLCGALPADIAATAMPVRVKHAKVLSEK